jgi:uncharacterized membrane protein
MITVTLYYRDNCPECDQVLDDLASLQDVIPHQLVTIDVGKEKALQEKYAGSLPTLEIGPYRLRPPFSRQDLQILLGAARDRVAQLERVDQEAYQQRVDKARTMTSSDRATALLSNHYLLLLNLLLIIYVGLPFLAPVLMRSGATVPAGIIYRVYGTLCHQLAFRSFFLFGPQPEYPRALAGLPGLETYEQISNSSEIDLISARQFTGNPAVGFKVALCERDVAIYGAMLLFGVVFGLTGRKLRAVPWYLWLAIGLVPIAIDGFSQLPGFIPWLPTWFPVRESTPFLRVLTGSLFGWMTAWYLFPMIEESASETRRILARKLAVIRQTSAADTQNR